MMRSAPPAFTRRPCRADMLFGMKAALRFFAFRLLLIPLS